MNNWTRKACSIAAAAALLFSASSCSIFNPEPMPIAEWPKVTAAPGKVAPPPVSRFVGYSVRIKPVKGPEVILAEPIAAEQLMDAFSTDRLKVDGAIAQFGNSIGILDEQQETKYTYSMSSDGQMLMKSKDGKIFRMPEYIYYLLEQRLWEFGGSLKSGVLNWQPESKSTELLETELPRLIKTAMLPAYGYAMTYFCSYKIYGVNTQTKDTAKLYVLLMYSGYDVQGKSSAFLPSFAYTGPATLIFKRLQGNRWQMVDFKLPVNPKDATKDSIYESIRKIFPYEYMEPVQKDMQDITALKKDIVRQATDFLRENKLTGLSVGD